VTAAAAPSINISLFFPHVDREGLGFRVGSGVSGSGHEGGAGNRRCRNPLAIARGEERQHVRKRAYSIRHTHEKHSKASWYRNSLAIQREAKSGTFLDNLEEWQIPAKGFNVTAFNQPLPAQSTHIVSPDKFRVATSQASTEFVVLLPLCRPTAATL